MNGDIVPCQNLSRVIVWTSSQINSQDIAHHIYFYLGVESSTIWCVSILSFCSWLGGCVSV